MVAQVVNDLLLRLGRLQQHLLLRQHQVAIRLHRRQSLLQHVELVLLLLVMGSLDLAHDFLLLELLDLLVLRHDLFPQLLSHLPVFQLGILHVCLSFRAKLLLDFLEGPFMLSAKFISLAALSDEL